MNFTVTRKKVSDRVRQLPAVRQRMAAEADWRDPWWACVLLRDGMTLHLLASPNHAIAAPAPEGIMVAQDICRRLNRELDRGGFWVVGWVGRDSMPVFAPDRHVRDYNKLVTIWFDADGDGQFTIENELGILEILQCGILARIENAETAWQDWHHFMRDVLDPKPGEIFHKAQGEAPPSGVKKPDPMFD